MDKNERQSKERSSQRRLKNGFEYLEKSEEEHIKEDKIDLNYIITNDMI